MFIPKGCVLLTAAVDRLAEARRSAGQTNDEGRNGARAELGAELHSGSMLATVVSPYSGDTFAIRPQHWGRETALTWLEQGECLLTEDFVYPSSVGCPESIPPEPPSLQRGERATIFVRDHDLQRLIAKQEVKQEAAPPPDPYEVSVENAQIVPARKGSPPKYDWEDAMNFAEGEFKRRGDYNDPQNAEDGWRSQADLARLVVDYMAKHNGGNVPSDSMVKSHLKNLLERIRQ